ncbi:YdcF family protein [Ramlibacter sp. AW1]|uniref:YdcF family protein n=1 Tax=Ramlibacter aurantiacus TaxID=2801330 RepID=A0A936ZKV4_9BURK|nr:YdcF family protein [Ramlibacter aurantiacus]MBL0419551.1 YdcF family protein [Ramlibacter aurantiacus]
MAQVRTRAVKLLVSGVLVATASGTVAFSSMALWALEASTESSWVDPAGAQALVVPAGALSRVRLAAELHQATKLPILLSGAVDKRSRGDSSHMRDLFESGYDITPQWLEVRARTTEENAAYSSCLLHAKGIHVIVLVTDADHMLRAKLWHQYYGFQVLEAPSSFSRAATTLRDFFPSSSGYYRTYRFIHELGGLAEYFLKRVLGVRLTCKADFPIYPDRSQADWAGMTPRPNVAV